jgi:hypothetical protein
MPKMAVRIQYKHILGGAEIDLENPKDLNEKINYLKFHSNMDVWARLADKYSVREYVIERGLSEILVPLYGKYDTPEELVADWNGLPEKFVIKTNHGCGTVKLVRDKSLVDLDNLKTELRAWLKMRYGLATNEKHYLRIKPCIIVEALLEDASVKDFSRSLVDYKCWCFDGRPYCFFIGVDRDMDNIKAHHVLFDAYDTEWNRIEGAMSGKMPLPDRVLDKPKNLERMLECAAILSKGLKQVRVDMYDIDGRIYLGEMTLSSQSGYMDYFSKDFLLELGSQFDVKK